jgi:hypothetical protein
VLRSIGIAGQQVGRISSRGRAPSSMEGAFPTLSQRSVTHIRIPRVDHSDRHDAGDPTGSSPAGDALNLRVSMVVGVPSKENTSYNSTDARHPLVSDPRVVNTADNTPAVLTTSFTEPLCWMNNSKTHPDHSIAIIDPDTTTNIADTMMVPNTNSPLQSGAVHTQSTVSSVRITIFHMYLYKLTSY